MGNCLVTKLKGTVDNPDLLKLGEIEVSMAPSGALGWYGSPSNPVRLRNKTGYFINKTTGDHETSISIGTTANYSLPKRDTVVIENPDALLYMEDSCDLFDSPYKVLYINNNINWTCIGINESEKPAVTFAQAVDAILSRPANVINKLFIRSYDFDHADFSYFANHSGLSKFGGTPNINFGMAHLTIDVADIAKLPPLNNFDLLHNYCGGTIEAFVAAARIAWPNKTSINLGFDCMKDRGFITTTFDGQNITLYENTYWQNHQLSWTANTITFMGKTISA